MKTSLQLPRHKLLLLALLCFIGRGHSATETPQSTPKLTGILNLPDSTLALLEVTPLYAGGNRQLILAPGQREGDVEVTRINPESGAADVRLSITRLWNANPGGQATTNAARIWDAKTGKEITQPLSPGSVVQSAQFSPDGRRIVTTGTNLISVSFRDPTHRLETGHPGLVLEDAGFGQVLMIYQRLSGRTLLIHPALPEYSVNLRAEASNPAEAALVLEKEFASQKIAVIPDGDKFAMVVPESQVTGLKPRSTEIKPTEGELLPAGVISFLNVDLVQVANIYAALMGRKLDRQAPPPRATRTINLKTQTPLSLEEARYALDTLFRWQGLEMIPTGDDLMKLAPVPASER
jgi:hypothetical protein